MSTQKPSPPRVLEPVPANVQEAEFLATWRRVVGFRRRAREARLALRRLRNEVQSRVRPILEHLLPPR